MNEDLPLVLNGEAQKVLNSVVSFYYRHITQYCIIVLPKSGIYNATFENQPRSVLCNENHIYVFLKTKESSRIFDLVLQNWSCCPCQQISFLHRCMNKLLNLTITISCTYMYRSSLESKFKHGYPGDSQRLYSLGC